MAGSRKNTGDQAGRLTVQEVAREAGVSTATVSRVTSGQGSVSAKTRQKVEAAIERLGYRPDLTAASLRQSGARRNHSLVKVAVLTNYQRYAPYKTPAVRATVEAGKLRGFQVEHFDLTHDGPAESLLNKLYNRGYDALIFEALSWETTLDVEALSRFALVSYDRRVQEFPCHIVRYDITEVLERTWDMLTERGYQRIGLIKARFDHTHPDERVMGEISNGLLGGVPSHRRIPLFSDVSLEKQARSASFLRWLKKYQPDVVVGYGPWHLDWLAARGLSVPEDVAFVTLQDAEAPVCGWRASMQVMADHALDLIEQMLRRGIRGPHKNYLETIIRPEWVDGETLRDKVKAAPSD